MREVLIRPRALDDLEGIWLYTFEKWGEDQASHYLELLNARILGLASSPEDGQSRDAVRTGYFSIRVGRHVIFYRVTDKIVGMERVLHDQMDFTRHP